MKYGIYYMNRSFFIFTVVNSVILGTKQSEGKFRRARNAVSGDSCFCQVLVKIYLRSIMNAVYPLATLLTIYSVVV